MISRKTPQMQEHEHKTFYNARLIAAYEDELVIEWGGLEIPLHSTHGHWHSEHIGKIGVVQYSGAAGGWVFVANDEQ
ncbi:MAG: hypothetical protein ACXV8Q_00290 [Methylobacter sp.]